MRALPGRIADERVKHLLKELAKTEVWTEEKAMRALNDVVRAAQVIQTITTHLRSGNAHKNRLLQRVLERSQQIQKLVKELKKPAGGLPYRV